MSKSKSKDEIIKLYNEMKNGSLKAREELILAYKPFVYHKANKFRTNYDYLYEDLVSSGFIGLIKAVDTYVLNDNTKLITYASTCINNEMLMFIRNNKKYKNNESLNKKINNDIDEDIEIIDTLYDRKTNVEHEALAACERDELYKNMEKVLTKKQKEILEKRYGINGQTEKRQWEVADEYDLSRSHISRIEKKAVEILRKVYDIENE